MSETEKRITIANRKARHDYFIEETFEAGICLVGTEVKSIRAGKASLQDSYARMDKGEAWLINMYVAPYEQGNRYNLEPRRPRKLLLHKLEIVKLAAQTQQKGLALIPLKIYFHHGHAKIELGLGKGMRMYDKREAIAEKDANREAQREMSER